MSPGTGIFAIINPRAASNRARHQWQRIQQRMIDQGFSVTLRFTEKKSHAVALTQEAVQAGVRYIVGIGGDGTFNEIINGYMNTGVCADRLPELGLIAAGTGSDLIRTFNIPVDPCRAVDTILNGRTQAMDIGKVLFHDGHRTWTRYFANVFDVGLGGMVVRIANSLPKSLGGFLTFFLSSVAGLVLFKPQPLRLRADGRTIDTGPMNIVGVANCRYFGGGMDIAPMARFDDGVLELLYVKNTNLFKFLSRVLLPVYEAKHLAYEHLYHRAVQKIEVSGDRLFLADIDGEEEKALSAEVSVIPNAIRIRTPR
ncbi:MAG TPA: diacylglycerol kinase family protein [bacterium]